MEEKNLLSRAWDRVVHGFTDEIDLIGRPITDNRWHRLIDTPDFKMAAGLSIFNGAMMSQYGIITGALAFGGSFAGSLLYFGSIYDKADMNENLNVRIINKNPNDFEKERYREDSVAFASLAKDFVNRGTRTYHYSMGAMGLMGEYMILGSEISSAKITTGETMAITLGSGLVGYLANEFATFSSFMSRVNKLEDNEWVLMPPNSDKEDMSEDISLLGRMKEALFPPAPQPI